jgi:hypothetical protein
MSAAEKPAVPQPHFGFWYLAAGQEVDDPHGTAFASARSGPSARPGSILPSKLTKALIGTLKV